MCGFVAVLVPGKGLPLAMLDDMRDRLQHRGPDGAQSWIGATKSGVVGLGHRRLSIIDLSTAAGQPMSAAHGRSVIVYNGEIYNFVELRGELEAWGATFRTRSDTEVLLAAYARWGVECLRRLNGMFAFAIWDGERQQLFVARDRFGEKPLFFSKLPGGGIALASEMKALFAHPEIVASADEKVVSQYVQGQYFEDDEATLFNGVYRLPPAHALLLEHEGRVARRWRYWTPDYGTIRDDYDEARAVDEFRERLARSISMRLRADVPIGTSLSGGLDSSVLVGMLAAENRSLTIQNTFSARFDEDPAISEGPEIDRVVRHAGVKSFSVTPNPIRLIEESRRLHWHQEEPFLSASIYLQWCVMRLAREHDTTVLLDGQGADEVLAGYQYYFPAHQLDLLDRGQLIRLAFETRAFRTGLRRASRRYREGRRRFNADVALSLRGLVQCWRHRPSVYAGPYEIGVPSAAFGMRLRRVLAEALQYNSLPLLLRYADRNAMAFGRETRFPYLDHDLIDWCIGLPDGALIRRGWQKFILRKAARGVIPAATQWRADKVGYAAPLDRWLRGPLKAWAHARLFSGPVTTAPGYDRAGVLDLWDRHQREAADVSWPLWRWISLNEWLTLLQGGAWTAKGTP